MLHADLDLLFRYFIASGTEQDIFLIILKSIVHHREAVVFDGTELNIFLINLKSIVHHKEAVVFESHVAKVYVYYLILSPSLKRCDYYILEPSHHTFAQLHTYSS